MSKAGYISITSCILALAFELERTAMARDDAVPWRALPVRAGNSALTRTPPITPPATKTQRA